MVIGIFAHFIKSNSSEKFGVVTLCRYTCMYVSYVLLHLTGKKVGGSFSIYWSLLCLDCTPYTPVYTGQAVTVAAFTVAPAHLNIWRRNDDPGLNAPSSFRSYKYIHTFTGMLSRYRSCAILLCFIVSGSPAASISPLSCPSLPRSSTFSKLFKFPGLATQLV